MSNQVNVKGSDDTAPTKSAVALAVKAHSIASQIGFADCGAIELAIEYGSLVQKTEGKLVTLCQYLQSADYEPEYFKAPAKDAVGNPVVIKAHFLDPESGKQVSETIMTTLGDLHTGEKAMIIESFFDADERRLLRHEGTKGLNDESKAKRTACQKKIGSYMAMVGKGLEKLMYPERAKKGKSETRHPIVRIKEDTDALAKYVRGLDPEKTEHFPVYLNLTEVCKALDAVTEQVAIAFVKAADAIKADAE